MVRIMKINLVRFIADVQQLRCHQPLVNAAGLKMRKFA